MIEFWPFDELCSEPHYPAPRDDVDLYPLYYIVVLPRQTLTLEGLPSSTLLPWPRSESSRLPLPSKRPRPS